MIGFFFQIDLELTFGGLVEPIMIIMTLKGEYYVQYVLFNFGLK